MASKVLTPFQKYLSEVPSGFDPTEGYVAKKKKKTTGATTAAGKVSDGGFWQSLKAPPAPKKGKAAKIDQALSGRYLLIGIGFVVVAGVAIYLHKKRGK